MHLLKLLPGCFEVDGFVGSGGFFLGSTVSTLEGSSVTPRPEANAGTE